MVRPENHVVVETPVPGITCNLKANPRRTFSLFFLEALLLSGETVTEIRNKLLDEMSWAF